MLSDFARIGCYFLRQDWRGYFSNSGGACQEKYFRKGETRISALGYERDIQGAGAVQRRFVNRPCKIMPDWVWGSGFGLIAEG